MVKSLKRRFSRKNSKSSFRKNLKSITKKKYKKKYKKKFKKNYKKKFKKNNERWQRPLDIKSGPWLGHRGEALYYARSLWYKPNDPRKIYVCKEKICQLIENTNTRGRCQKSTFARESVEQ